VSLFVDHLSMVLPDWRMFLLLALFVCVCVCVLVYLVHEETTNVYNNMGTTM